MLFERWGDGARLTRQDIIRATVTQEQEVAKQRIRDLIGGTHASTDQMLRHLLFEGEESQELALTFDEVTVRRVVYPDDPVLAADPLAPPAAPTGETADFLMANKITLPRFWLGGGDESPGGARL